LAYAVTIPTLDHVHVDMIFVLAVGAGSEHGAEAGAGCLPQAFAKILGDAQIGQAQDSPTPKLYGHYVERVCLAVLGELGPDDTISTAALVRDGCA